MTKYTRVRSGPRGLAGRVRVERVRAGAAAPQQAPTPTAPASQGAPTICGVPVPPPANLPPAGSGPVLYRSASCFPAQGNVSTVEPQTYLYYMELSKRVSRPSQNIWMPYNEEAEQIAVADHKRLWATSFLDDLSIDAQDYTFSNGVDRQARDLQHGGARARQDRQLRGQQADRSRQGRRAAPRAQHRAAARHVRRQRDDPPDRDGAARDDGGEGLHQRLGRAHGDARLPAARSW